MTEKITLRSKADPSVVLPEAVLKSSVTTRGFWEVELPGSSFTNSFPTRDWEMVTPPYELPVLPGAVVSFAGGYAVLADHDGMPWRVTRRGPGGPEVEWSGPSYLLGRGPLTTVSEGFDL